jgi:hypothetical protein
MRTLFWLLPALFAGRVFGQLAALIAAPSFLPPYEAWDSNTLPYPVLLSLQALVLCLQARIAMELSRTEGFFTRRRPRAGRVLTIFAWVYAAVMVARWVLTMAFVPELRWFGHAIPITFHFVLAGWLWTYARFLRGGSEPRATITEFHELPAKGS